MTEQGRIDELRRRVQADPTSIAFAALAEEYRRAGQYEEAVAACRSGLVRHPAYVSARLTLGRALLDLNDLDAAQSELEQVLQAAPENLVALRALSELQARRVPPEVATAPLTLPAANTALLDLDVMPSALVPALQPPAEEPPHIPVLAANPILACLGRLLDAVVTLKRVSV